MYYCIEEKNIGKPDTKLEFWKRRWKLQLTRLPRRQTIVHWRKWIKLEYGEMSWIMCADASENQNYHHQDKSQFLKISD